MNEPLFLSKEQVLDYHRQQIALFGGQDGLADSGLLDSALAQPQNICAYVPSADLFDIAAAYAFHVAKNHAFIEWEQACCPSMLYCFSVLKWRSD